MLYDGQRAGIGAMRWVERQFAGKHSVDTLAMSHESLLRDETI